jgi:hypothetical protein
MKENSRKSIVEQIVHLANNVVSDPEQIDQAMKSFTSSSESPFHLFHLKRAEGITFMLADNTVNDYEKLLERLLQREGWGEKFSEEYLDKAIRRILVAILKEGNMEITEHLFDTLCEEFYTYAQKQVVYIPVVGITLHTDTFPIGNIIFRKMTDAYVDELFEKFKNITLFTLSPQQVKETHNEWTKQMLESLKGTVCAEFYIVAEPDRARERAEEEVRRVLDLLRYASSVIYRRELNVAVGLQGEVISAIRTIPILSLDEQVATLHSSRQGLLCPFELTFENVEKMKQIGIFKVAKILEKPHKQTDYERTLLRGIHWFATSQMQVEGENELLNLITCLETFLADGKFITNTVAVGAAHLLATQLETRKVLKKILQDLYGMRSGVSHGGQKTILEQNLADLRAIAKELIFQMIKRKDEFPTQKSFTAWLEERQLLG